MTDPVTQSSTTLQVPAETQAKFGAVVELIKGSESMNMEERQYWINILPVMTEEQLRSLNEILVNEKAQLAAIDAKYAEKKKQEAGGTVSVEETGKRIRANKSARDAVEMATESQEQESEASILERIRNM
ncbi:MAG: hypothetical protein ABL890_00285 [Candidatus Peribacteraceae bacterium]